MDGFINVLKPPGISSNQVVVKMRKILGQRKIGHSGTLDPGATGVLVLGVNKGTRLLEHLLNANKHYRAEMAFGIQTSTGDGFGKIIQEKKTKTINEDDIKMVLKDFIGEQWQTPPMTSAVKVKGKKLYELARAGETIERKPRLIEIHNINLDRTYIYNNSVKAVFDVQCSKGTYIRTLCEDIADKLDSVAYMSFLVRTRIGPFKIQDAFTMEEIVSKYKEGDHEFLRPLDFIVDNCMDTKYILNDGELKKVLNGVPLKVNVHYNNNKLVALCNSESKLVAQGIANNDIIRIQKVFK